ncbi:hypothetical protein AB0N05_34790 [Nocardia sp. NPDC051030]|uniref:hypothetical protein n=1 Tax=Nocardia sp. NPDC051030 TaxID=3155162 RepID=UPI0034464283
MIDSRFHPGPLVLVAAACCSVILAAPAFAKSAASIAVDSTVVYNVSTLTVSGSATCDGGGTAGVNITNGSLEQMFQGGVGGPIAIQLDGAVLVDCDGSAHTWSGNLVAPGRILPTDSGGSLTATLSQGSTVIATTGSRPIHIVR